MRSYYLTHSRSRFRSKSNTQILSALAFVATIIFSTLALFTVGEEKASSAEAWSMGLCGQIGHNMYPKALDRGFSLIYLPFYDKAGVRTFNLNQAFGPHSGTPIYYGESSDANRGGFWGLILADTTVYDENDDDPTDIQRYAEEHTGVDNLANLGKMEEVRGVGQCTWSAVGVVIGHGLMGIAGFITRFMTMAATFAFDSNIICSDPDNPSGMCFNLVALIGGKTGETAGGLIGSLTNSIYMPLMIIAVAIAAASIGYKGLVKRQFRAALSDTIWVIVSIFFGTIMLLNPQLLARAPMAISNSLGACIIGAFNGENCFSGSSVGDGIDADADTSAGTTHNVCRGNLSTASPDEQMSIIVNNISCSIWKAFILQPYAQINFGASFEDMDVNTGKAAEMVNSAGLNPDDFCVGMVKEGTESLYDKYTSDSQQISLQPKGSVPVCNILSYQMYLRSGLTVGDANFSPTKNLKAFPSPETQAKFQPVGYDPRWYSVIAVVAQDQDMWQKWTKETGSASLINGTMAIFTSFMGAIVIVIASLSALVFYISSVILMAFAPLFFLFGIHPGAGKRIFLGWLEQVVSNIMKYLASAFFVLISIAFYGGVLGNSTNPMMTFIFVTIITFALMMYRKELLNLIGRVNMGGEQMGNNAAQFLSRRREKGKQLTAAAVGAGIGAVYKGDSITKGLKDGTARHFMRQPGMVGNAVRHASKTGQQIRSNITQSTNRTGAELNNATKDHTAKSQMLQASTTRGTYLARELEKASNDEKQVKLEINADISKAKSVSRTLLANANAPNVPNAEANALREAAIATDKITAARGEVRRRNIGERSGNTLMANETAGNRLADAIAEARFPEGKRADARKASNSARRAAEMSEAMREGRGSEMLSKYGQSGEDEKMLLQRLEKERETNVNALGNSEFTAAEGQMLSDSAIIGHLQNVEEGKQASDRLTTLKRDELGDAEMEDEKAFEQLVQARKDSFANLSSAGVNAASAAQFSNYESQLNDASDINKQMSVEGSYTSKQKELDDHHVEHLEREKAVDAAEVRKDAARAEASVWSGAERRQRAGESFDAKDAINFENTASNRRRTEETRSRKKTSQGQVWKQKTTIPDLI